MAKNSRFQELLNRLRGPRNRKSGGTPKFTRDMKDFLSTPEVKNFMSNLHARHFNGGFTTRDIDFRNLGRPARGYDRPGRGRTLDGYRELPGRPSKIRDKARRGRPGKKFEDMLRARNEGKKSRNNARKFAAMLRARMGKF